MEPLTNIEFGRAQWLGILAIVCAIGAELLSIAQSPSGQRATYANREKLRRAVQQQRILSR